MPNHLELFDKEEYVIPSGEFFAQQFSLEKDADLKISGKWIGGQATNLSVMTEGDWEWMLQNGNDYDVIKTISIDTSEIQKEKLRLSSGEYIVHLEPATHSKLPSRISLNAHVNVRTIFTARNIIIFLIFVTAAIASLLAPAAGLLVLLFFGLNYLVYVLIDRVYNKLIK
jgi:hypothetical protein